MDKNILLEEIEKYKNPYEIKAIKEKEKFVYCFLFSI